ncbi:MAG: GxxExxY protein [Verrucomicrobiota bacterium]|nr:GxxExxY protein [Verrucomicrobiota bacterium]
MRFTQSPQSPQSPDENQIARVVLDAAFRIHTALGPGLLESVYEVVLAQKLARQNFAIQRQLPIPVHFEELKFDEGFRADIVVNGLLLIEVKSVEALSRVHSKQVLTYLRLSGLKLGLLINFGEASLKNGIKRIVNGLSGENPSQNLADSADFARTPNL